jgi:hypothetical protein
LISHKRCPNPVSQEPIRRIEEEIRGEEAEAGEKIADAKARANNLAAKLRPVKGQRQDKSKILGAAKDLSDSLRDLIGLLSHTHEISIREREREETCALVILYHFSGRP